MTLSVQNSDGTVTDAAAYVSVTDFKAYHSARGNVYSSYSDAQIEVALTKATDYLDRRFLFVGYPRQGRTQTTKWPRWDAYDVDENLVIGIPVEVVQATCEYAFRALSAELDPDPTRDATGREIASISQTAGPVSESITYRDDGGGSTLPEYPAADQMLRRAGLVAGCGMSIQIERS